MVKFLLTRPIAVSMTFVALLLLGIITSFRLPVSLLPSIDIPKITIQLSKPNAPAREIENSVVLLLRRHLMQLSNLKDINSESRDGSAIIKLSFEHGTNIDYAFIEANEKVDRAMGNLPSDISHPKVIKASASDIPVFYLSLSLKDEKQKEPDDNDLYPVSKAMLDLSNFAEKVIKKHMEQLPEVAMIDISGLFYSEILILPDINKLESLNLGISDLEQLIKKHHIDLGNLVIRDGQYQFNIRFSNTLSTKSDIENLYLKVEGQLLQLKDLAQVIEHPQKITGKVLTDGKIAISMAVIKQAGAQIQDVKQKLDELILTFEKDYPHIKFTVLRDQSKLLNYTISNLKQSLLMGTFLALLVMLFFLKDFKSPLLITISVPTSLIMTMLFFYLFGISFNIISLSGLILGLGMMIDNSIIVIDNITQYREMGYNLKQSCIKGTNEVIMPLFSSILTTCAVFIPLVFVGGIAGSLFYEQAISISIGLFISLTVSITLLPVYYKLIHLEKRKNQHLGFLERINKIDYNKIYEKGFHLVMKNQFFTLFVFLGMIVLAYLLYNSLRVERLPRMEKTETLLKIDWNQRINITENERRTRELVESVKDNIEQSASLIGEQQFLLDIKNSSSSSEALIYLQTKSGKMLDKVEKAINRELETRFPEAIYQFEDAGNIFNIIFDDNEANFIAKLRAINDFDKDKNMHLQNTIKMLADTLPEHFIKSPAFREIMVLQTNPLKLALYDISFEKLYHQLQAALSNRQVYIISSNNHYMPVIIGEKPQTIKDIIKKTMVENEEGIQIPIRKLLTEEREQDLKTIIAGQEGEYYPLEFDIEKDKVEQLENKILSTLKKGQKYDVSFGGGIFDSQKLLKNLLLILLISMLLLYFILAAQFESLSLPLIVLLEIPIDIFGAFLLLKLFGAGLNLMSMIGIIVMSGIVINDSILKIDTINKLMKNGYSLIRALIVAGHRRLKPILMTSLTTILALIPVLFTSGMGSDLQKPLALAIIGGMTVGTIVSLYFVPLLYYYLKKFRSSVHSQSMQTED